ncbi:MAG: phosphoenolpyruvate carboxylase [Halanaeroarchaeum sp.]
MVTYRRDIESDLSDLDDVLASVIETDDSRWIVDLVDELESKAAAYRSGSLASRASIRETVDSLSNHEERQLARALTTSFQLTNLAEERERVRTFSRRRDQTVLPDSLHGAAEALSDVEADTAERILEDVFVQPTFTAHPTEARRKTVKAKLRTIAEYLEDLDERTMTDARRERLERALTAEVESLWETPDVRESRPDPLDEARNVQWYLHRILFSVIGTVYDEFEDALAEHGLGDVPVSDLIAFRSWAGSDRDGNPYVTPEVTGNTLDRQRGIALDLYAQRLDDLIGVLSQSRRNLSLEESFERSLQEDREELSSLQEFLDERYGNEPYRQKVILMRERIDRVDDVRPGGYENPGQFVADIEQLVESLDRNDADAVVETHVEPLRRQATTFGFVMASLDLRDHRKNHTAAVAAGLEGVGIEYETLSEPERQDLLSDAILQDQPIVDLGDRSGLADTPRRVFERFEALESWHDEYGVEAIDTYCISMTEEPSHVLEVLFLADQAGVVSLPDHGALSIVPLLETESALSGARRIMETLFENEAYRQLLAARDRRQEVMLGYSDSKKENGFLAANWSLNRDQRRLAAIADDHDVHLRLFHGRGGSISRGGGPMNEALLALPPETVTGDVKFTEQGEAIAEKYGNPTVARRNVEQMINAQIRARERAIDDAEVSTPDAWRDAMETMADAARVEYRDLLDTEGFVSYFESVTPIATIEDLNLGSRPASRSGDRAVEDLRAIPWVFSWTQSRWIIPGWYGLGTGIDAYLSGDGSMETLREMYEEWPFFRTMLDNAALALARSEPEIADEYARLAPDTLRERFALRLRNEYDRTVSLVREVTNRDRLLRREWLIESLERRNPSVDPLNVLQVDLLDRSHRNDVEERALRLTVKGIAAGMKNTG